MRTQHNKAFEVRSQAFKFIVLGLSLASAVSFTGGCSKLYDGDGDLISNGPLAATQRYVLELGPVDLSRRSTQTFRIHRLPPREWVFGIKLPKLPESISGAASISLQTEEGETIFSYSDRLENWTWNVPRIGDVFAYGDTYGHVKFLETYQLSFVVTEPLDGASASGGILVGRTGGWK